MKKEPSRPLRFLHASHIAMTERCPILACHSFYENEKGEIAANMIVPLMDVIKEKLQLQNMPAGRTNDTPERTKQLLQNKKGGINLRFEAEGIRTKIPVLLPLEDGTYHAIYGSMSNYPRDSHLRQFWINDWLAEQNGVKITRHSVVHINKDYVRKDQLDPDALLILSDHLYKKGSHPFEQTIDEQIAAIPDNPKEWILQARQKIIDQDSQPEKCRSCTAPRKCSHYEECWNESQYPDDSIQFLASASSRQKLADEGIERLRDVPPSAIEGFPIQFAQIMADRQKKGRFFDKKAITSWIQDLQWPLIYLDFEWDTFAIPPYPEMMPYDVLCFEFSEHVEEEDGTIRHTGYFGREDCRREFIEKLLEATPKTGSVIVYNMDGAEKLRLMQLARQFPEYEEELRQIWERMVDLSVLFEKGSFYDIRQRNHYSLKSLLPLFDKKEGYDDLKVRNGLEAIEAYRKVSTSRDDAEIRELIRRINDYCSMDTEAEIILLHGLRKKLKKPLKARTAESQEADQKKQEKQGKKQNKKQKKKAEPRLELVPVPETALSLQQKKEPEARPEA